MNALPERPCILVAEDEMLVAMMLEAILEEAGYRVSMAARLRKALDIAASQTIHAAILDINLAGEESFPLAEALIERGVPFVFASGYGASGLPAAYRHIPVLQKPYSVAEIESAVTDLLKSIYRKS